MGTLGNPGKILLHIGFCAKGPSRMHRLDKSAERATDAVFFEGSLVSLDDNGKFVAGCPVGTGVKRPMPMWSIQNSTDFDANSDENNISGTTSSAVVATGGFEVVTTEFVAGAYTVNTAIIPALGADAGKVKPAIATAVGDFSKAPIVGIVSAPPAPNHDNVSVIKFWSMFIPANLTV